MSPGDRDAGPACGCFNVFPHNGLKAMTEQTSKTTWEVMAPAVFTLLGVFVTGLVTYMSAMQAASVNSYQSCIARIDQKESEIRKKAEEFTVSFATMMSFSTHSNLDIARSEAASDNVLKSGYALSSYTNDDLSDKTQLLALITTQRLDMSSTRNRDPAVEDKIRKDFREAVGDWRKSYRTQIKELNEERVACKS